MSMPAKAAGAVYGANRAVFGTIELYTVVSVQGEVRLYSQQQRTAEENLHPW
jgi:hypothetical protein